jgi:electron transport complex protein RnfG
MRLKIFSGAITFIFFVCMNTVSASQVVSLEQGLKDMFGTEKTIPKEITVTAEQVKDVNKKFGQTLIVETGKPVPYTFYSAKSGDAAIETQQGKWGQIQMIILMDAATGKVKNLEVLALSEKRGRPIVMRNFLSQFVGKGMGDTIEVSRTINAVTGATISSRAVAIAVKRAIAVHDIFFPKSAEK